MTKKETYGDSLWELLIFCKREQAGYDGLEVMWLHNESPDTLQTVHYDILFILSFGALSHQSSVDTHIKDLKFGNYLCSRVIVFKPSELKL